MGYSFKYLTYIMTNIQKSIRDLILSAESYIEAFSFCHTTYIYMYSLFPLHIVAGCWRKGVKHEPNEDK